jgi:hypothetical protein
MDSAVTPVRAGKAFVETLNDPEFRAAMGRMQLRLNLTAKAMQVADLAMRKLIVPRKLRREFPASVPLSLSVASLYMRRAGLVVQTFRNRRAGIAKARALKQAHVDDLNRERYREAVQRELRARRWTAIPLGGGSDFIREVLWRLGHEGAPVKVGDRTIRNYLEAEGLIARDEREEFIDRRFVRDFSRDFDEQDDDDEDGLERYLKSIG